MILELGGGRIWHHRNLCESDCEFKLSLRSKGLWTNVRLARWGGFPGRAGNGLDRLKVLLGTQKNEGPKAH